MPQRKPTANTQLSMGTPVLKPTPPPPQSRSVSISSQVSGKSKAPPPVAKKPSHLASTSPLTSPSFHHDTHFDNSSFTPELPRRASTHIQNLSSRLESSASANLTGGMHKPSSPRQQVRRVGTNPTAGTPSGGVSLPGLGERKPVLPPRTSQLTRPSKQPVVDLLGANDSEDMNHWETLRPHQT
ncbi:uncharacterized protein BCR38DRAFT_180205 [Pseudomassariella vexata]|uniref:Uncharacterized protein n=1 Tax=Pseudomassariella vexata TaxID=1141098 RepID=A0A1Y2E4G1_9PEZI|nr:uncharacterized protein BCR38DRAFT_180205 [Pseudomassariella vexata]ORY66441.1 hypothetical protein BCR38DRAFT_180205 [Pseudomassariella vexata]